MVLELFLGSHVCSCKDQICKKIELFLMFWRIGLLPEWYQKATPHIQLHYLQFLICFFISRRESSTKVEAKRSLCSTFRAVCLWNVLVNFSAKSSEYFLSLWVHNFILVWEECQEKNSKNSFYQALISASNLANFRPWGYFKKKCF